MANPASEDPFLTVQSDVLVTLTSARSLFSSYLRIRALAPSPTSPELQQSRSELLSNLDTLAVDLPDLADSVRAVEDDPYRFGLDLDEVSRRRKLVNDVGGEIEAMRREVEGVVNEDAHPSASSLATPAAVLPDPRSFEADRGEEDDAYGEFETQVQAQVMAGQDEQIHDVFQSVGRLRGQAEDMGRELEEQTGMLQDVDTLADRVGGKLQGGLKKVAWVVKKNEGKFFLLHFRQCFVWRGANYST